MLRRNVLIFQMGGLGDFILTWPLALALGRIYPQSRIFYVTHPQKGDLARRVLRLESTDAEAGWHRLFADAPDLPPVASKLLQGAHAVYTFLPVSPLWLKNVQTISPGIKCVQLPAKPMADSHLLDAMIASLENPEKAALEQMLRSIHQRGVGFTLAGGDDIIIHPGSGSPTKCWPIEKFAQLASQLIQAGHTVRFVIGEVEAEHLSATDQATLASIAPLHQCHTLLDLLHQLSTAAVFIGNDTGPSHLAGIIGLPTIALFGPTDPKQWSPLGPLLRTLRREPIDQLPIQDVLSAVEEMYLIRKSTKIENELAADD